MKKILFVITKSNWGGAQAYTYNLASALPKTDYLATVALGGTGIAGSEAGELEVRLTKAGIQTFFIPSFARDISFFSDISACIELYKLFKNERPDVVHLNSSKAGGVGALAARFAGVPKIIFTSHGLAWDEDRGSIARLAIGTFSWLTFLLCHQVVAISTDNFNRMKALPFCNNKIVLIHNGLPELQFESRERARLSIAATVGLSSNDGVWIGTIAELTKNKGLSYLIEASKILVQQGKLFKLFIIGTGEEKLALKMLIEKHSLTSVVYLVGFIADAYRYDKAFDMFVLSSVKEGLPTVLLEAGQACVPIVSTNIPGTIDIIEDQKTGLLAEVKNIEDLANKLTELIDDEAKRKEFATNLQQKMSQQFTVEQMVLQTKTLYRS